MDSFSKVKVLILSGLSAGFAFSVDSIQKGNFREQIDQISSHYYEIDQYGIENLEWLKNFFKNEDVIEILKGLNLTKTLNGTDFNLSQIDLNILLKKQELA